MTAPVDPPCLRARLFLRPLAVLIIASQAGAQNQSAAMASMRRGECDSISALLNSGLAEKEAQTVISAASNCPVEGPQALARAWPAASADTMQLNALVASSSHLRDQRISNAVVQVAENVSKPTIVRIAALSVLVSYVDSSIYASTASLMTAGRSSLLGQRGHDHTNRGAMPPGPSNAKQIIGVFERLAAGDPDPTVKAAAAFVLSNLELLGVKPKS